MWAEWTVPSRQAYVLSTMTQTQDFLKRMSKSVVIIIMIACFGSLIAHPQARRGAPQSANAERIQTRTYLFKETNEKIDYAVFVSTRVKKEVKSPLVIALHGAGVSPEQMLSFVSDAAQDHGYVVVAPMGYSLEGWYGVQNRVARGAPANLAELSEKDVMNVLDLARKEFNVDERRIYLLGQSMGGAGAL